MNSEGAGGNSGPLCIGGHMDCFEHFSVNATGAQVTTAAISATVAIPVNAAGRAPKHVRLQSTGNCYVRAGTGATTCTVNDILLSPNNHLILNVMGFTHIAHLQELAGAKLNITPLES